MKRVIRNNSLSLVVLMLFVFSFGGQIWTGFRSHNQEQRAHEEDEIALSSYLTSGHAIEATFENWESEFLQMALYVMLTAVLFQKGSSESKDPEAGEDPVDVDPRLHQNEPGVPWPVRRGGWVLRLYEESLSLALLGLFVASFVLHLWGGARAFNEEQSAHGDPTISTIHFLKSADFWFQSFQNWQSEFLSIATLALLSIFLRQRSSPESKPVASPHVQTGS